MAVGGGLTWWSLTGQDDYTEVSGALEQACRASQTIQDFDILWYGEFHEDGKRIEEASGYSNFYVSGESYHLVATSAIGGIKIERLYYDGDLYFMDLNQEGKWDKKFSNTQGLGWPFNPDSICPDLAHFTYEGLAKMEDETTKYFTAPTVDGEPYGEAPVGPDAYAEVRDWGIWINEEGHIVKVVYSVVFPKIEGEPVKTGSVLAVVSGHGEPNNLPIPR